MYYTYFLVHLIFQLHEQRKDGNQMSTEVMMSWNEHKSHRYFRNQKKNAAKGNWKMILKIPKSMNT
ncbi:hypothetical protein C1H46_045886 [Malus baccata]|uniref:Uncharacterized protein n=1 Tax=Malus baccata TaxID=106549 RepID=A0A540K2T2_MALBA|nr:hypothetical protein C1H46_045886 [Malus baccata]